MILVGWTVFRNVPKKNKQYSAILKQPHRMWRHLTANAMEKLSHVVAPMDDDDSAEISAAEDIDSTTSSNNNNIIMNGGKDNNNEDESVEYYDDEESHEEGGPLGGGAFGFVGMLTRALDGPEEEAAESTPHKNGLILSHEEMEDETDEDEAADIVSEDGIETAFEDMQKRLLEKQHHQNTHTGPAQDHHRTAINPDPLLGGPNPGRSPKSDADRSNRSHSNLSLHSQGSKGSVTSEVRIGGLRRESGSITPMRRKKESFHLTEKDSQTITRLPPPPPQLSPEDDTPATSTAATSQNTATSSSPNTNFHKLPSREDDEDGDDFPQLEPSKFPSPNRANKKGIAGKSTDSLLDEVYPSEHEQRRRNLASHDPKVQEDYDDFPQPEFSKFPSPNRANKQGIAGKSTDSLLDEVYPSEHEQRRRNRPSHDHAQVPTNMNFPTMESLSQHPTVPAIPNVENPASNNGRFVSPTRNNDTAPHLPHHPHGTPAGRESRRSSVDSDRRSSVNSSKSIESLDQTFSPKRNRATINSASVAEAFAAKPIITLTSSEDGDDIRRRGVQKHNSLLGSLSFQYAADDVAAQQFMAMHDDATRELEYRCETLQEQLQAAQAEIEQLRNQRSEVRADKMDEDALRIEFQQKEVRLLQAAQEGHEMEISQLRENMQNDINKLTKELEQERKVFDREKERFELTMKESSMKIESVQREKEMLSRKMENEATLAQKQRVRDLRMTEDKLAHTLAQLDEKNAEVKELKKKVKLLESTMSEHQHGAQEIEEEMDEIHQENEDLRQHAETVEAQCLQLQARIAELQADSDEMGHLKMEIRMLQEDLDRERNKNQSVAASAESNYVQIQSERDAALATARELKSQMEALRADLHVAKADYDRIVQANTNLQQALESFQSERDAELNMLEEQRLESEQALVESHKTSLEATKQAHKFQLEEVQQAADAAVRNSMLEIQSLEEKLESRRHENVQLRRSLDEAIQRLQSTQEDIIDRTLMKNILLDWLTKTNSKEKRDVLDLMASVLHFTDEEKERVHIGGIGFGKVVGSVTSLPPSKVDIEQLEGDNVREKWVNFLLSETED